MNLPVFRCAALSYPPRVQYVVSSVCERTPDKLELVRRQNSKQAIVSYILYNMVDPHNVCILHQL